MNAEQDWADPAIPRRTEPIGAAMAHAWTRVYTAGAPAELRDGRRSEIASDTWEQRAQASPGASVSASIVWRTVRGMPADVSWRFENASPVRALGAGAVARGRSGLRWTERRALPGITLLLAGGYVALGFVLLLVVAAGGGDKPAGEQAWAAGLLIGSGALIALAFKVVTQRRKTGLGLLVAGLLPFSLAFAVTVVVPVASILALVCGWRRSRQRA